MLYFAIYPVKSIYFRSFMFLRFYFLFSLLLFLNLYKLSQISFLL
nr:MAG TPA: hypothetical protein [Caudoviricetes sp.]